MKQPKVKVTDINGKEWGFKKVTSMNWDHLGNLWMISVDFMETGISGEMSPFYDYDRTGEFVNRHGNLKAKLIF